MITDKLSKLRLGLNKHMTKIIEGKAKRQWDCPITWRLCIDKWEADGVTAVEISTRLKQLATSDRLERASDQRFHSHITSISGTDNSLSHATLLGLQSRVGHKVITRERSV